MLSPSSKVYSNHDTKFLVDSNQQLKIDVIMCGNTKNI